MKPLFDLVLRHVTPPHGRGGAVPPARHDPGGQSLSRPHRHRPHHLRRGQAEPGRQGARPRRQADRAGRVTKVLAFRGLERVPVDEAEAGDIVAIAGLPEATVAHTICAPEVETPIPAQPIDPPTLAMTFRVNDSPLAGTEGNKVTGRMIRDRLLREAEGNVALRDPRIGRQGLDGGRRPRRAAARHPDRDHAARRLRAVGVAPEGAAAPQRRRRARRADRRGRDRRRRGAFRRRGAEDVGAQGRAGRDAARPAAAACGWCSTRRRAG